MNGTRGPHASRAYLPAAQMNDGSFGGGSDTVPSGSFLTMDELREITEHLLRFSPDALIVVDDRDRIRFANETVRELFGHAPDSLIGKPLDSLIPERLRAHHGKHTASYARTPNNREMGARIA